MKKLSIIIMVLMINQLFGEVKDDLSWKRSINWDSNNIEIRVKTPMDNSDTTLAAARIKSEHRIDDNITDIFFKNILDIDINSLDNVSAIININPEIYYKLDTLAQGLIPFQTNLSTNLEYLETIYKFPIYPDLISVFYSQTQHVKLRKKLDHLDYGRYTGLIIYVPKELPLFQKNSEGSLNRVLFPRIYNEDMSLILDLTMVEPEYMKKWGMVVYGDSFNEELYQNRIGITPLRIIALGIFGKNSSDLIISNEEANKIIGSDDNLKILSQARILILN